MSVIRVIAIVSILAAGCLVFAAVGLRKQEASADDAFADRLAAAQAARDEHRASLEAKRAEREARRAAREARWEKGRARMNEAAAKAMLEVENEPKKKRRRVRRFKWESPAEVRGKLWNVPEAENEEALLTALLRVGFAEADGDPQDMAGIWQVVKNNRQRSCRRGVVRRITECEEDGGETYLSAIRRHQRHVLGYIPARNKRAAWIRNLTPECEMPEGYQNYVRRRMRKVTKERAQNHWDGHYGSKVCPQAVADARRLINDQLPESRPGHRVRWLRGRPVTWGGACELKGGACDDHIACQRVLARIPDTSTVNAFWCRVGNSGCRRDPEPVCIALGYQYKQHEYRGRMVWKLHTIGQPRKAPVAVSKNDVVASDGEV